MNELQTNDLRRFSREDMPAERMLTAHDLAAILWRHLWLILLILAVSVGTAAFVSHRTPPAWRANAELLLVQRSPVMASSPQAVADAPMIESLDTQISLLQSRALAQEAAQKVGVSTETLQNSAAVTPRKDDDNVIDVSVEADSRQRAMNWANALCQAFVQYKKSVAQHNSQETLATLKGQAAQARKQRTIADAQFLVFEKTHHLSGIGVLDAQAQKTAALNAVLTQDTVIANFRNDYATAQARVAALDSQLQQADLAIKNGTGVRDDNATIKLQEDLQDLERTREQTALRYKGKFPGKLAPLDAEIADTRARLNRAIQTRSSQPSLQAEGALKDALDSARADAGSAQAKLTAALAQRDTLQQATANLPQLSMEADRLSQNMDQAHALYNSLSAAVRAAQIDQDAANGNVQIVQPAFAPDAPVRPDRQRDLLVGLGVGLFLSLVAVLVREQSDQSVRAVADARRLAEGPVVGVLPQLTRARQLQFSHGETPPQMIETYNAARAGLSLAMRAGAGLSSGGQVVLISSTLGGEGKSLTASELAQSFARAGRRVVLVNADMRRPSSLPLLRGAKEPAPGLAEVLSGKADLADALVSTEVPNLSLLRSGNPDRNPIDLFSQPRTGEMIDALRETAEVIVIDTPPSAVVADALLLAPYADCLLYVVAIGMADGDSIKHSAAALAAAAPGKLSYFINRAPQPAAATAYYDGYYQQSREAPAPEETRDHSPWRTMVLDRALLPTVGGPMPTSANGSGGNGAAHSPLRVLPEFGSHLVALEGPYVGQKFALSPSKPLTLGILPDNDIVLARDATISRIHARIAPETNGGYILYDDSSTNGTLVNDIQVTRQPLNVGDVIQLGASKFRYE